MTYHWISFNNGCSYTGVEGCRDGYCCTDLSDVCPAYGARPGEPDCYCDVSCSDTGDCCSDFLNECFRKCSRKWSSVFSYRFRVSSYLWRCLGTVYFSIPFSRNVFGCLVPSISEMWPITACPLGETYNPMNSVCEPCPVGTYRDVNSSLCQSCQPAALTTLAAGATSAEDCVREYMHRDSYPAPSPSCSNLKMMPLSNKDDKWFYSPCTKITPAVKELFLLYSKSICWFVI